MHLKVQLRRAGNVVVLQCEGPITSGPEVEYLEQQTSSELEEGTKHLVLEVSAVPRVDSSGLGMMVRLTMRARKAGGDLKIASPPAFVTSLLEMTRLATLFHVFPSAQEAVASYRARAPEIVKPAAPKARIILLDQSHDLCAFVRTVLTAHGYEVLSTNHVKEARIFLQVGNTDVLMLGPNTSQVGSDGPSLAASLAALSPKTRVIELDKQFQTLEAEQAGTVLLQLLSEKKKAGAAVP